VLGINEVNMVNTCTSNVSSVTTENCLLTNNIANSERRGLMDSLEDVSIFVMKITRRCGWPLFKMLNEEDYCADSYFAKFIMKKSQQEPNSSDSKLRWGAVKKYVTKAMQNSCPVCTRTKTNEFKGMLERESIIVHVAYTESQILIPFPLNILILVQQEDFANVGTVGDFARKQGNFHYLS
jgi:RNA polymerase subunit RPABC4/transcription elongation factor Spt4